MSTSKGNTELTLFVDDRMKVWGLSSWLNADGTIKEGHEYIKVNRFNK